MYYINRTSELAIYNSVFTMREAYCLSMTMVYRRKGTLSLRKRYWWPSAIQSGQDSFRCLRYDFEAGQDFES